MVDVDHTVGIVFLVTREDVGFDIGLEGWVESGCLRHME